MSEVSIAAVTYRNLPQTKAFVDSVLECTKEDFQLVMVDNGSPKDLAEYLDSLKDKVKNYELIRNSNNMGIGVAMNQAMRACKGKYIFRCDSDVIIQSTYWTELMREVVDKHPEVGAVGTSITGGTFIKRDGYLETDICLSNCMLIPRRTLDAINVKMRNELPRVSEKICELIKKSDGRYDGYYKHLGGMLNYMHYHGGLWDINFPYGADDFHYSMLIRYAGLRITKDDRIRIIHKDESMRTDWQAERHRRVSEGFQYYRTFWEVMLDHWQVTDMWATWPMNKAYLEDSKKEGMVFQC